MMKQTILRVMVALFATVASSNALAQQQSAETSPMMQPNGYAPPALMGQWSHMQSGLFVPFPQDQLPSKKYLGWRHTQTWFNALLRNSTGKFYLLSNVVLQENGELTAAPWVGFMQSGDAGGVLTKDERAHEWGGKASFALTGDKITYVIPNKVSVEDVSFNEKTIDWKERAGTIQLKGPLVAPAIQFIVPWREPDGNTNAMYFTAQYYKVEGTYQGENVNGYARIEHMWGSNQSYRETWWVRNRIGLWSIWTTEYDDGTTEVGEFLCGRYGARGAIVGNSKGEKLIDTTEYNAEMKEDGRVVFTFATGPQWEYIPQFKRPNGGGIGIVMKRIGEKRKVVRSQAMFSLYSGKMCDPVPLGQGPKLMP